MNFSVMIGKINPSNFAQIGKYRRAKIPSLFSLTSP